MKLRSALLAAVLAAASVAAAAQGSAPASGSAAAPGAAGRIAFVSTERILRDSAPALRAQKKLEGEFKKRDDKWLFAVDKSWPWGPTNNYCKWFHVCEHEANHNGQIKFLKGRLPGAHHDSSG